MSQSNSIEYIQYIESESVQSVDLIDIFVNKREEIINIITNYDNLKKLFSNLIDGSDDTRLIYQLLSGKYQNNRNINSSIDWIPSTELIKSMVDLATFFDIEHIEELYAGTGIISALLTKELKTSNKSIMVTTADTFNQTTTCNKLDLMPIAKRGANDYNYYSKINEKCPDMVISTYYPDPVICKKDSVVLNELIGLIHTNNHKIIIIFLSLTCTYLHHNFYLGSISRNYQWYTYHVKAISKYYHLENMMNKQYESLMVAHIFIRKDTVNNTDKLTAILEPAIIPSPRIDTFCYLYNDLIYLYDKIPTKVIEHLYEEYNVKLIPEYDDIIGTIIGFYKNHRNVIIPNYIHTIKELLFWSKCVTRNMYLVFADRSQFAKYHSDIINIRDSDVRRHLPHWIGDTDETYIYLYLKVTQTEADDNAEWKKGNRELRRFFRNINDVNIALCSK